MKLKKKPYQTSDCGKYWDYNFKIKGVFYEISVEKKTGKLYINKDENQSPKEYLNYQY